MRTGIFGGSFNPIHKGHTELIKGIISELSLDRLLIVPTFLPPHKSVDTPVAPEHRINMCRLAAEDIPRTEISDIEIRRGGKSYTYETLLELHAVCPNDELFLIMGADMFLTIETWKRHEIIFSLATICGVPRKGVGGRRELEDKEPFLQSQGAKTRVLKMELPELSSTELRAKIRENKPITGLVPALVEKYIREHNLYL